MGRDKMEELINESQEVEEVETAENEDNGLNVIDSMVIEDGQTSVSVSKNGNTATYGYKFGEDLNEMVELFSDEMVFSMAKRQMIVKLQAAIRPIIARGESAATIVEAWRPDQKRASLPVDKKAAAESFIDGASKEDLEVLLAKIKARNAE